MELPKRELARFMDIDENDKKAMEIAVNELM
jgi:hypothetical protein